MQKKAEEPTPIPKVSEPAAAEPVKETVEAAAAEEATAPKMVEPASAPAEGTEAKVQASDVYDVSEIKVLPSTNNLRFRESFGSYYQLMDADMNVISDKPFIYLEDEKGFLLYALEEGVNTTGVMDAQGNVVVPAQYGTISIESDKWILAISLAESDERNYDYFGIGGGYYLLDHVDVYYCGTQVGTFTRDEYDSADAYGDYLYVNPRIGDAVSFNKEFVKAEPRDKNNFEEYKRDFSTNMIWHLGSGTAAFTAECTLTPEEVETAVYNLNGALYDLQGNVVCSTADYSAINPFIGGYAVTSKSNNKCGIIAADGTEIAECIYDKINLFEDYVKSGYAQAILDGKFCFICLADGNVIKTDFAKDVLKDASSPFATKVQDDGTYRLISAKCGLLPDSFSEVGSIYSVSPIVCVGNGESFGVINLDGEYLVPCDGTYMNKYSLTYSDDGSIIVGETSDGYIVYHITY